MNTPDTHAANSRPEIELTQAIKDLPRPDERSAKYEVRAELDDLVNLIAQEADKLANKRLLDELEFIRLKAELAIFDGDGFQSSPAVSLNVIDRRIEKLDKGDSQ